MQPTSSKSDLSQARFSASSFHWAVLLSAFLVLALVIASPVRYTFGDSRFAMLTSQSILENGTPQLDAYVNSVDLTALNNGGIWMVFRQGTKGHFYYDYPVGTPIFSLPFVGVGRMLGMDMLDRDEDAAMQMTIASLLCLAVFLLLLKLARLYLPEWSALIFALAIFFGTSFASTMGTALWSQDFQAFFILLIILELAEVAKGKRELPRGIWLGFLLFAAYLCRPTSAALIVVTFALVAWKYRPVLAKVMGVSAALFLVFILWSWGEFGTLLPRYYDPTTWRSSDFLVSNILPVWFGPARGFWSFTPVFLLCFGAFASKRMRKMPAFYLVWIWLLIHTFLLLRSQAPWGGWCFGPRFFTELVPGFAWLLLMLSEDDLLAKRRVRHYFGTAFLVLSGIGISIHTVQGLYNQETQSWNDAPSIDHSWEARKMDWRYPQFLASKQMIEKRKLEFDVEREIRQMFERIPEGEPLLFGEPNPALRGFFKTWNRQNHFGANRVLHNSIFSLKEKGESHFWCPASQLPFLSAENAIEIDSTAFSARMTVSGFLEKYKEYEIVIAARDEATSGISRESRLYMAQHGSMFDSLKLRESYIGIFKDGKVEFEAMGPDRVEYESIGPKKLKVESAGLFAGNFAKIMLNGQDFSSNLRGLNVLVLDKRRNVIWATSFDTHSDDFERASAVKVRLKLQ